MENLFRARWARITLAVAAIAGGLWGFAPYMLKDIATSAYVNAEVTRVVSPLAGMLSAPLPKEGAYLPSDQRLTLVTARAPDRTHLDELERVAAVAASSVDLVQRQLAELDTQAGALTARTALYREASLSRLEGRARLAQADLTGCEARLHEQQDRLARARKLAQSGFIAQAALRSAEDTAQASDETCKAARASVDVVKTEARAAAKGVFLSDGASDAPFAEQQLERLTLRRQELMDELVRARAQQAELDNQLGDERRRFERAARYEAVLPAGHLVWTVAARSGSQVAEGQALLELADCRNRFIVVELPARRIEHLSLGDPARIRLLGSSDWISGHVRRITGGAAKHEARLYAAEAPRAGPRSFIVEVALDTADLDARRSCDIGRPADVRFDKPIFKAGERVAWLDRLSF